MKNSLGETLAALRRAAGLTQPAVSELLAKQGIDILTAGISKWEKGLTQPSAAQFLALCRIYGVTDVLGTFTDAPVAVSRLNAEGRRLVSDYIRVLVASGFYEARPETAPRVLPLFDLPASAGTGQFLDGDRYEQTPVGPAVPESADFGVRIAGDSMEPEIPDGSIVWVRRRETLESGRIGVFAWNGDAFCKKLETGEGGVRLVSLNPAYRPLRVTDPAGLRVFGEVVAVD